MFRATFEPMPDNPPDRVPHTGLWKVVIYDENGRFVRSDREYISYFEAKKLSEQLNRELNIKSKSAHAS
jgi:hypothetical protein